MKYISLLLLVVFSMNTLAAWDGATRGFINTIEVTNENNFAFRVHLQDSPTLCGNANTWAYLNKSDSNYETYVALLTAAKFAKTEVTLYASQDSNNFCRIGHIAVH